MCYVVGDASSGKVWCFVCFSMPLGGAEKLFFFFFAAIPQLFQSYGILTTWHILQLLCSRLNGIDNIIQDVISSYFTHTDIAKDARSPYPHRYCQGCDTFLSILILSKMRRLERHLEFISSINLSSLHH